MKQAKKTRPEKKKLSGSASRKLRRKKLVEAKGVAATLIKMPYVGKLETVNDWHTQIAKIYRRTLIGEIPEFIATKLTYIATAGATLAKMLQELREIESLRQQLAQLQNTGSLTHGQEYLPAASETRNEDSLLSTDGDEA
jgi:hypothetical protein